MVQNTKPPKTQDKRVCVDTFEQPNVFLRYFDLTSFRYLPFQDTAYRRRYTIISWTLPDITGIKIPIEGDEPDVLAFPHGLVPLALSYKSLHSPGDQATKSHYVRRDAKSTLNIVFECSPANAKRKTPNEEQDENEKPDFSDDPIFDEVDAPSHARALLWTY